MALLPSKPWLRGVLSALILFHLIVVPVASHLAFAPGKRSFLAHCLVEYVFGLRLQQYWALFSPEPRREALRYSALISFRDGRTLTWQRPYPPNWDFFARHLSYSFQKWDLVSNYLEVRTPLWDSLVDYLGHQYGAPTNPVTQIRFIRSSAPWPAPRAEGYVGGETKDLVWTSRTIFTYDARLGQFL